VFDANRHGAQVFGAALPVVRGTFDRAGGAVDSGATVAGVPRQHPAGGVADVGAVQVGPDAFGEVGDRGFAQAGIRAGRTRLGAFDVRLDAPGEGAPVDPAEVGWVGVEHRGRGTCHDRLLGEAVDRGVLDRPLPGRVGHRPPVNISYKS